MTQSNQGNDTRILIVEDDDAARTSLERMLRRVGYTITTAVDGEEAVAMLDAPELHGHFDVVLSDLLLREIDGVQVLRHARQLADPPEVVLLTGYGTLQTAVAALRAGAYDYLLKPSKPDDLIQCVRRAVQHRNERLAYDSAVKLLASSLSGGQSSDAPPQAEGLHQHEATASETVTVGELMIRRADHSVTFAGRPVALTTTEYAILVCLADARGRVVSYVDLVRQVYNQSSDQYSAHQLFKTHIHNLRHKISADYIVNVRSVGYRLVAPTAGISSHTPDEGNTLFER
jgi:DNA-binding response OmpR family regulator